MRKRYHTKAALAVLLGAVMVSVLAGPHAASADPTPDGKFDPAEGYTSKRVVLYDGGDGMDGVPGLLYTHQNPTTGDLYAAFLQDRALVDNTYGANCSPQWDSRIHKFKDLARSDGAAFTIMGAEGRKLLEFEIDYIEEIRGQTDALGRDVYASRIKDDKPDDVLTDGMFGTSLDYNFNELGLYLTEDSPEIGPGYTILDPAYNGWLFDSIYEFKLPGSLFEGHGFGEIIVEECHNSPHTGQTPDIPEPATMSLLAAGGMLLLRRRRTA